MRYVQSLGIPFLFSLVKLAREKEDDEKYFTMYCAVLPYMEESMSFEDWKEKSMQKSQPKQLYMKSTDEIMEEILGGDG